MTDANANTLPGADPANAGHPLWAAEQLARMLMVDDGFDHVAVSTAFLMAAECVARERGNVLALAIHMEREAVRIAVEIGTTVAVAAQSTRN